MNRIKNKIYFHANFNKFEDVKQSLQIVLALCDNSNESPSFKEATNE